MTVPPCSSPLDAFTYAPRSLPSITCTLIDDLLAIVSAVMSIKTCCPAPPEASRMASSMASSYVRLLSFLAPPLSFLGSAV